jgi:hypothetical protein
VLNQDVVTAADLREKAQSGVDTGRLFDGLLPMLVSPLSLERSRAPTCEERNAL